MLLGAYLCNSVLDTCPHGCAVQHWTVLPRCLVNNTYTYCCSICSHFRECALRLCFANFALYVCHCPWYFATQIQPSMCRVLQGLAALHPLIILFFIPGVLLRLSQMPVCRLTRHSWICCPAEDLMAGFSSCTAQTTYPLKTHLLLGY